MTDMRYWYLKVLAFAGFLFFLWIDRTIERFIFIVIAIIALAFGIFLFKYPLKAFDFQRKFYAIINWKIEPISLQKEIRNTKGMGLMLMLLVILASIYFISQ